MRWLILVAAILVGCGGAVQPAPSASTGAPAPTQTGPATATVQPTPTVTPTPAPTPTPLYDHLSDLSAGECFDPIRDKDDQLVIATRLRSCDEAHLAELLGQAELPGGVAAPYPGDAEAAAAAEKLCGTVFADYVGISYDDSRLEAEFIYPGVESWAGGDRVVSCFVIASEVAPLTRSVKGSRL